MITLVQALYSRFHKDPIFNLKNEQCNTWQHKRRNSRYEESSWRVDLVLDTVVLTVPGSLSARYTIKHQPTLAAIPASNLQANTGKLFSLQTLLLSL